MKSKYKIIFDPFIYHNNENGELPFPHNKNIDKARLIINECTKNIDCYLVFTYDTFVRKFRAEREKTTDYGLAWDIEEKINSQL